MEREIHKLPFWRNSWNQNAGLHGEWLSISFHIFGFFVAKVDSIRSDMCEGETKTSSTVHGINVYRSAVRYTGSYEHRSKITFSLRTYGESPVHKCQENAKGIMQEMTSNPRGRKVQCYYSRSPFEQLCFGLYARFSNTTPHVPENSV